MHVLLSSSFALADCLRHFAGLADAVSKTVKGGRIMKFAALVVVGDGKGNIGYGIGKSGEVPEAIRKGEAAAKKNMHKVAMKGTTLPQLCIRARAATTYGRIGVKVWVYKGEVLKSAKTAQKKEGGNK